MFGWLKRMFGRDGFHPGDEAVYRYYDGRRWVDGDPMELLLLLNSDESFGEVDLKMSAVPDRNGAAATLKIVAGVRKAFKLPPQDKGGLGAAACIRLLTHFWTYLEKKNLSTDRLPTFANATAASDANSPEGNCSGCTSTETESQCDAPTPSHSES